MWLFTMFMTIRPQLENFTYITSSTILQDEYYLQDWNNGTIFKYF